MKYTARDISLGGLFGALGVVVPILFHLVGLGMVFLPMHLPVLICGLLVSPPVAFAVGFVTPVVSSFLTGMPPFIPMAILMSLELGALAGVASLMHRKLGLPVILSIVTAMAAARMVGGLERLALAPLLGLKQGVFAYLAFSVVASWPGIVIQLLAVPAVMRVVGPKKSVISEKNAVK